MSYDEVQAPLIAEIAKRFRASSTSICSPIIGIQASSASASDLAASNWIAGPVGATS
jgi:hypothetical protein